MSNKILSAVVGASSGLILSHLLLSEENPPENIEYDSITGKMKLRLIRPTPYKEVFGQFIELLINAGAFVAGREVFFTITDGMRIMIPALQYRLASFFRNLRRNLGTVNKAADLRDFYKKTKSDLNDLRKGRTVDEEIKINENTDEFMKRLETLIDEFEEDELKKPKEEKKFDTGTFFTGSGENVINIPKPIEFGELTEFEGKEEIKIEEKGKEELEESEKIENVIQQIENIIPNNPVNVIVSNEPLINDLKQDTGEEIIDESETSNHNVLINDINIVQEKMFQAFLKIVKGDILNLTPETKKREIVIQFFQKLFRIISRTQKNYEYLAENLDVNEITGIIELIKEDVEKVQNKAVEMGTPSAMSTKSRPYKSLINKLLVLTNTFERYILYVLRTFLGMTGQGDLIPTLDNYRRDLEITNNILSRQQLNQIRNLQIDFSVENLNSAIYKKYFANIQKLFIALTK